MEGNPFAVYFGEEMRRSRPLEWQVMVTERVVTVAKCWLVAAYVEGRLYRMAPDLAREIERLDPADATVADALGGAENVKDVRSLAAVHNHVPWELLPRWLRRTGQCEPTPIAVLSSYQCLWINDRLR